MLREGGTTAVNYPTGRPDQVEFGSVLATRVRIVVGTLMMILGIVAAILFIGSCAFTFVTGREL